MSRLLPASGPGRLLAAGSFVDSLGSGLFLAVSTLYFVGGVGIAPGRLALALAVAGCLGLFSSTPSGRLADRYGVRPVYVSVLLLRALAYSLYVAVDGPVGYLAVTCLATVADRACSPLTQTAVRTVVGARDRNRTMASIRALRNVGYTVGTLVAAAAVAAHSTPLVHALFLANGLTFLVTAWCARRALGRVRQADGTPAPSRPRPDAPAGAGAAPAAPARSPLRSRRFLALTVGNGLMCLHDTVLVVALPVWVLHHDAIPQGVLPVLLALNTALTVLVQLWISALDVDRRLALRMLWGAAGTLVASCLLVACAGAAPTVTGTALLAGAVVLLTLGENLHAACAWYLSDALAPASSYARHIGAFGTSVTAHGLLGPALVLGVLLPLGAGGWGVLGALFAAGAGGMGLASARAAPSRGGEPAPEPSAEASPGPSAEHSPEPSPPLAAPDQQSAPPAGTAVR
ncbi:MFS transporter [Streptomyces sp. NPDC059456]|uniref:MFS transporter n=1 Tax=Streptomyces sp. NPDC059456 TaxID=3346838 RepID=UPI0036C244AF